MDQIEKIENRTEQDLIGILQSHGLPTKNKWKDYSRAKEICFESLFIDCDIYDKQIGWICNYLGI
jgi:hypothetical protein